MGIIEGNMRVLANAHAHNVGRMSLQQVGISGTFDMGIASVSIKIINGFEGQGTEQPILQIIAEALGGIFWQTNVFIHMKSVNPSPVDSRFFAQLIERFILGGCRRKNDINGLLIFLKLADLSGYLCAGILPKLTTGWIDKCFEPVDRNFSCHRFNWFAFLQTVYYRSVFHSPSLGKY